jgi:hypothetical protein
MATFTNTTKNSSSFTNTTKNSSVFSNIGKGLYPAVAGQAMGLLLALTYSEGQSVSAGVATFTNLTKN